MATAPASCRATKQAKVDAAATPLLNAAASSPFPRDMRSFGQSCSDGTAACSAVNVRVQMRSMSSILSSTNVGKYI